MKKTCRYCFEEKELEEFVRCKYNKNGRQNMCYECKRKKNKLRDVKKVHDNYFFGGNRDKVLERDGYKCVECGMTREAHMERYGRDLDIDHIDGMGRNVLKEFKNNDMDNLRTLCLSCHKAHHNKVRYSEDKCEHEKKRICDHLEWKFSNVAGKIKLFFKVHGTFEQAICEGWINCPMCSQPILPFEKPAKKECSQNDNVHLEVNNKMECEGVFSNPLEGCDCINNISNCPIHGKKDERANPPHFSTSVKDELAERLWRYFPDARGVEIWKPVADECRKYIKEKYGIEDKKD